MRLCDWLHTAGKKISTCVEKTHLPSTIFWACILFVGHHAAPSFFEFPEQLAYTIAANLQADKSNGALETSAEKTTSDIVVKVDTESAHNAPYFGEIPTQRCALASDLEKILLAKPRALVIDVDVSPTNRAIAEPSSSDALCAKKLDALLSTYAAHTVIVAMHPLQFTKSKSIQMERSKWVEKMTTKGLHFGLADIAKRVGDLVTTHETEGSMSYVVCQLISCAKLELGSKQPSKLINFGAFKKQFVSTTTTTFSNSLIQGKVVFFGFGVDGEDTHLTPLGMMYGVDIHAAAYASMKDPLSTPHGIWSILADIILGLLIGGLAHHILHQYIVARKQELKQSRLFQRYAYGWLLLLVVVVLMMGIAASWVAFKMLEHAGIWLSPIVMIFAMLLDALCRVPISILGGENHTEHPKSMCCRSTLKSAGVSVAMLTVIWYLSIVAVLGFTIYYLLH